MEIIKQLLVSVMLLPWVVIAHDTIEIFTISSMPVFNSSFDEAHSRGRIAPNIYALDVASPLDAINDRLQGLSPEEAEDYVKSNLYDYQQLFAEYYRGQLLARKYGLTHLPAVVINEGEYIIYGLLYVNEILKKYIN